MKTSIFLGLLTLCLALVLVTDPGLITATFHALAANPGSAIMAGMAGPAAREFGRKAGEVATELPADADIKTVIKRVMEIGGEVKNFAEDVKKKMAAGESVSTELKVKSDKGLTELEELRTRLDEFEKKHARKGAEDTGKSRTPGFSFIEDTAFKAISGKESGFKGTLRVGVPSLKAVTSLAASAGVLVPADRRDEIIGPQLRRLTVRDLLMQGRTNSNLIEFMKELVFTNNAGVISEGMTKPQSDITFEEDSAPVRTIAHWLTASKQILADAPRLQSYIDGRLLYGLKLKEEGEILNGSGAGQHLEGLVTQATAYSAPITVSGATLIDTLRLAHLQAELAEFPSTGQVLNPKDWAQIELTKDEQGRYIFTNPVAMGGSTLWGRPVVATQSMTVDKFLVGAFSMAAEVVDREDAAVEVSTEDGDNFKKNLVTIRAEERVALPVYRPAALIYGGFGLV